MMICGEDRHCPLCDDSCPSYIEVVPVKELEKTTVDRVHAHWIHHPDNLFPTESTMECSHCHEEETVFILNDNYCPNCGAKMDEEVMDN